MLPPDLIFISYRKSDSAGWATLLADRLRDQLGNESVFLDDSKGIAPGTKWPDEIEAALERCRVFLPVIGSSWHNRKHKKRLFEAQDWVRRELCKAVSAQPHVVIIPVFVDEAGALNPADFSKDAELKAAIEEIGSTQGIELSRSTDYWDDGIDTIIETTESHTGLKVPTTPTATPATGIPPIAKVLGLQFNRDVQFGDFKLRLDRAGGECLYLVGGHRDAGHGAFANRCQYEMSKTNSKYVLIKWKLLGIGERSDDEINELMARQIMDGIGIPATDGDYSERAVSDRLLSVGHTVFLCRVNRGLNLASGVDRQRVATFFDFWQRVWKPAMQGKIRVLLSYNDKRSSRDESDIEHIDALKQLKVHLLTKFEEISDDHIEDWLDELDDVDAPALSGKKHLLREGASTLVSNADSNHYDDVRTRYTQLCEKTWNFGS